MFTKFFHANIVVSNLERSIKFYEQLGFKVVDGPFEMDGNDIGKMLGFRYANLRAVFMRLGDDPNATMLDVLEFLDPVSKEAPYKSLNNLGVARLCFSVDDVDQAYEKLQKMGVEFVSPPEIKEGDGQRATMFCFKDPDGTFLEILDFQDI
ncbi:MAG TPA: VOC family protein [Allosphingosinicella sp.]|nr:VOC family protein [Allosphingosinicella sp.]